MYAEVGALDDVAELLASATGLRLPSGSRVLLRDAVATRALAVADGDAGRYLRRLTRWPESDEVAELFDLVAVGQTEFFRHPALYAALGPQLQRAAAAAPHRPVQVWSAGCSTGQEVWSLAATCADVLGPDAPFRVWGQDLSRPALAAARQGSYPIAAASQIPHGPGRFFDRTSVSLRPSAELRAKVRIVRANLVADAPPVDGPVDAVFFCNVAIYFSRDVVARVVANLASKLAPDGLLFLGRAESLLGIEHGLEVVDLDPVFAYRLPAAARDASLAAAERQGGMPSVGAGTGRGRARRARPVPHAAVRTGQAAATQPEVAVRASGRHVLSGAGDREAMAAAAGALAAGRLELAAEIAADLLGQDAFVADAHYVAGVVAERRGDDDAALGAFERAVYVDPACALAHVGRAGVLERRGEVRRAAAAFAAAAAALADPFGAARAEPYLEDLPVAALAAMCRARACAAQTPT